MSTEYLEPSNLTADRIVEMAKAWRINQGMGPVVQGRAAQEFRAQAAHRQAAFLRTLGLEQEAMACLSSLQNLAVSNSIFAEDMIRETIAATFLYQYPAAKFASGDLITIVRGGRRGALTFGWGEMDRTGNLPNTGLVSEQSDAVRSVDLVGKQFTHGIATNMRAFDYTMIDLDTAQESGLGDLVQMKSEAVKSQVMEDIDAYIGVGVAGLWNSIYNLEGIFTMPATSGTAWASATNTQIVTDVLGAVQFMRTSTTGLKMANTAILSIRDYGVLERPALADLGGGTLLDAVRRIAPDITRFVWERNCPNGTMLLYKNSPEVVAARLPIDMEFLPPEATAAKFRVICRSRFAGAYSRDPRSILKVTGL